MAAPPVHEPPICVGCGILIDPTRAACETCTATYVVPAPAAVSQPGSGYWVAIRGAFLCGACGYRGPLNHFEDDDGVTCTKCGVEQKFDASWKELVVHAHAIGDFGTPGSEGRFPHPDLRLTEAKPYATVGSGRSWTDVPHGQASLGNPLCRGCHAPLIVVAETNVFAVECTSCKERRSYERGPARRNKLAGALADEHEIDRREVGILENEGAMIITCPNCNGQLENVKQSDGAVSCSFCSAKCRISTRTHARLRHVDTPSKVWWFYFATPCVERQQLVRRMEQAIEYREKLAQKDRQRAHVVARENGPPRAAAAPPASRPGVVLGFVILAVILAGLGVAVYLLR